MTNETKHTPTPWVIMAHDNYMPEEYGVKPIEIVDGNGGLFGITCGFLHQT